MTVTRRRFVSLGAVLMLLALLMTAIPVSAAAKSMHCIHADFTVEVDSSGNALICESWECQMSGDVISRYVRHYSMPDDRYMTVQEIAMDGDPLTFLDSPDEDRPEGCAAVYQEGNETIIEMYFRAQEETHTFSLTYYVENLVAVYNDCAEFHWNLNSEHEAFDIDLMTAHIEIPTGTQDHGLYFWGVGPEENASFTAEESDGQVNQFDLHLENIPKGQTGGFRFATPRELFPNASHQIDTDALENILEEQGVSSDSPTHSTIEPVPHEEPMTGFESFLYSIENSCYDLLTVLEIIGIFLALAPLVFGVALTVFLQQPLAGIYLRRQYKKNRCKPARAPQYYRGLPDDMDPALVHKLTSVYPIKGEGLSVSKKGNPFSATILDLVNRGLFEATRMPDGAVSYYVSPEADDMELTKYEHELVELFREAGAGEAPITTKDLTDYMRMHYSWCKDKYRGFFAALDEAFEKTDLVKTMPGKELKKKSFLPLAIVNGILIFIGLGSMIGLLPGILLGVILGPINIMLVRSAYCVWRPKYQLLTQKGEDHYALWMAYKRYLEDFTTFHEREVSDIKVWRKYLVYAAALGCSKKVIANLKIALPEVYDSFISDLDFPNMEELERSVSEINTEGGYTIRSSDSDSSDSGGSDGWGEVSSGGGDSDTGSSGSDFD